MMAEINANLGQSGYRYETSGVNTSTPGYFVTGGTTQSGYFSSFNVQIDTREDIDTQLANIQFDDPKHYDLIYTALSQPQEHQIHQDDRIWQYVMTMIITKDVVTEETTPAVLDFNMLDNTGKYDLIFIDVTDYYTGLANLRIILIGVGFFTIIIIYLASLLFANRAIAPLEVAWQKQKDFITNASHELKTPLSIMQVNYDVLMEHKAETLESQTKWLSYMQVGMLRMQELVNSLLSLARLEDTTLPLQVTGFNLSDLITTSLEEIKSLIEEKEITLEKTIIPAVFIHSNEASIRQILLILLDNATKYTNVSGKILVSLVVSGRYVQLRVTNTGVDLDKHHSQRIFERFYRGDAARSREQGGYGLGLAIAKTLADKLNAKLFIERQIDDEITFCLSLRI